MKSRITAAQIGHDLLLCVIAGVAASVVVAAIGALLGLWLYDPQEVPVPALQGAVSGLLVVGSLGMLCSAFFFTKRKRKEDSSMNKFWKQKFQCFNYQVGFLVISVVTLALGCLLDLALVH